MMLTSNMLNPAISRFDNSLDPDQLASPKPADQDLSCFLLALEYMLITECCGFYGIKIGEECSI